jgi:hypothetical protein
MHSGLVFQTSSYNYYIFDFKMLYLALPMDVLLLDSVFRFPICIMFFFIPRFCLFPLLLCLLNDDDANAGEQ